MKPATQPVTPDETRCQLCGEPMSAGEEMFNYHGYSGPCQKPPLAKTEAQEPKLAHNRLLNRTMTTLAQHATSPIVEHGPQLGDIIIHNYGALVYIGTIECFCTHNLDMVEGPALVVGGDDARFYECQSSHYFPLSKCKVVSKPPVMPFDDEAVPEANIPAMTGVDTLLDIPEPLGGALEPSEESKQALRSLADTATKLGAPLVLGSAPDEEPF